MRHIKADRAGEQSPVPDRHKTMVTDPRERSVHSLDRLHDSITSCVGKPQPMQDAPDEIWGFHFSMPPVFDGTFVRGSYD